MSSNPLKPSLPKGRSANENENETLVAPPGLAEQLFGLKPPSGTSENQTLVAPSEQPAQKPGPPPPRAPSENETLAAPPDLAAQLLGVPPPGSPIENQTLVAPSEQPAQKPGPPPPRAPSENETVVAPPELAAQLAGASPPGIPSENQTLVAPAEQPAQGLESPPAPPSGGQSESLALALDQVKALGYDRAVEEAASLNGLAIKFGAAGAPAGGAPPLRAATAPAPGGPPKLRAPSLLDLGAVQPEGAGHAVLTPAPPPTLTERVRDAMDGAVASLREAGPAQRNAADSQAATGPGSGLERRASFLDSVRARLPEKYRGIPQWALGLGVGAVLALPILFLILIFVFSGS